MINPKIFFLSIVIALGALCISYAASNWDFMGWEEKSRMARAELVRQFFSQHTNHDDTDVVFIDISYDKELRDIYEDDDINIDLEGEEFQKMPLGNTQVTDRSKLLKFLQILQDKDDYKYILLDIAFPDNIDSSPDSILFATIASMRDIVIPRHEGMVLADTVLIPKSAPADYKTLYIESDFIKFPFLFNGVKSIPVIMYEATQGGKITNYNWFSVDNGKLARNSIPLPLELRMNRHSNIEDGINFTNYDIDILLLGKDILGDENDLENDGASFTLLMDEPDLFKDKYIVIGSLFGDDNHSTYTGDMPGSLIIYNAFLSLKNGHHLLSLPILFILFLIFFLISYSILIKNRLIFFLKNKKRQSKVKYKRNYYRVLSYLVNNFAIETSLAVICVMIYLISDEIYDIIVTGFYFLLISWFVRNYSYLKFFAGKLSFKRKKYEN